MECFDKQVWIDALEALADRILWDRDFELYNQILSAPGLLSNMRISPTYYSRTQFPNSRGAKHRLYVLANRILKLPQPDATAAVTISDRIATPRPTQKEPPKKRTKK